MSNSVDNSSCLRHSSSQYNPLPSKLHWVRRRVFSCKLYAEFRHWLPSHIVQWIAMWGITINYSQKTFVLVNDQLSCLRHCELVIWVDMGARLEAVIAPRIECNKCLLYRSLYHISVGKSKIYYEVLKTSSHAYLQVLSFWNRESSLNTFLLYGRRLIQHKTTAQAAGPIFINSSLNDW